MASVFAFMKGRYKRVTHIADNSGTAIGHAISAGLRKIDKRAFDVYQSTATGKTKDSAAAFSFFKQPKVLLLLCVIGYSVWNMGSNIYRAGGLPAMLGGSVSASSHHADKAAAAAPVQAPAGVPAVPVSHGVAATNPFGGLVIYLVGDIAPVGLLFQVEYPDKTFISVTQKELEQLGFTIAKINSRMARITFESELIYALPKPVALYVADSPNVVQPEIKLIN
jgi:zona occludens toxin